MSLDRHGVGSGVRGTERGSVTRVFIEETLISVLEKMQKKSTYTCIEINK